MMENIKHFSMVYGREKPNIDIEMRIDNTRFEKSFSKAQLVLDNEVMTSMLPYMPMQTGTFMNVTQAMSRAIAGTGQVIAAAPPMGRFLYYGKVMVDPVTRSPWARAGAKKVVIEQDLDFNKAAHPEAQAFWFEAAKNKDLERWLRITKEIAGNG